MRSTRLLCDASAYETCTPNGRPIEDLLRNARNHKAARAGMHILAALAELSRPDSQLGVLDVGGLPRNCTSTDLPGHHIRIAGPRKLTLRWLFTQEAVAAFGWPFVYSRTRSSEPMMDELHDSKVREFSATFSSTRAAICPLPHVDLGHLIAKPSPCLMSRALKI